MEDEFESLMKPVAEEDKKSPYDNKEIIDEALEFTRTSSSYFSDDLDRAKNDMEFYSNSFWNTDNKKLYKRQHRLCGESNEYKKITSAITSTYSACPYHIQLMEAPEEIQNVFNTIESDSSSKTAIQDGIRSACITGYGYLCITSIKDEYSDNYKWIIENLPDISSVVPDPSSMKASLEDAEQGGIITYLPVKKAKRLYGSDIISGSLREQTPLVWNIR